MIKRNNTIALVVMATLLVSARYLTHRYWTKPMVARETAQSTHPLAPAFKLTDIFGQRLSLDQYRGKVIVMDFWATWCGPCRLEIPGFIQLQRMYGSQGLQLIGVSEDDGGTAPVAKFYQKMGMDYPVAVDDGKVALLYGGIYALPTTFLIGRDGRIYEKFSGAVGADEFMPAIKTLLAAAPDAEVRNFQPMRGSGEVQVETPAEANSVVPGIDLSKLNKRDLTRYEDLLAKHQCTCGCQVSVLRCRRTDPGCTISRRMARQMLQTLNLPPL